jgi:6-phosphofructokinase 1
MNAALRAIVRGAFANDMQPFGIRNGYAGLIDGQFLMLGPRDVGGIIHQGGTTLGTSRCPEFTTDAGQRKAMEQLQAHNIDCLVVIGGNGSQAGAHALSTRGFSVVGVASTIDNDIFGTDVSIGCTTAVDVALENIDRLRVTAASHHRVFLVEVMGRASGYLALMSAIAGGAEAVVIPELATIPETIGAQMLASYERGKSHAIVVVAEGAAYDAESLARYFQDRHQVLGFDLRVSKLGHIQRGGTPGAFDRLLATQLGAGAIDCIKRNEYGCLIGMSGGKVTATPLQEVTSTSKSIDIKLIELAGMLAQ